MNMFGSDEIGRLMEYAHYFYPELVYASRSLPITIIEIGGTIRVFPGSGIDDTRHEDMVDVLPYVGEWIRVVAAFLGPNGKGVAAQRAWWSQRIKTREISYAHLAKELNTWVRILVRQDMEATDAIALHKKVFTIVGQSIKEIRAQGLSESELAAAHLRIARIYADPQIDAMEQLPDLQDQQRATRDELWLLLRAGGYPYSKIKSLLDEAMTLMREGEPPFPDGEPFTRERIIDCLRAEQRCQQARQIWKKAA